ncbi:putative quinol monooxygenase [Actinomadura fibrosa]|uniref:Quinol monooxygenase n=1 Tax=Actinomadura fibrosa TaxID=111802 RepID=A0ABW2XC88_9ACTN|nr:antibiotic biosynthesis monooxygenase [Actinomadura fibrosa]
MATVSRYGKMVAHEGRGADLARLLLGAADALADDPGCELYLVNRQADAPDTIWVTELWRSQEDLDAALARIRGSEEVSAAMALVRDAEMVELDLLGGKGLDHAHPAPTS